MNLTTSSFNSSHFIYDKLKSMALPVGILVLIVMMVIPLPSYLLDLFFTSRVQGVLL